MTINMLIDKHLSMNAKFMSLHQNWRRTIFNCRSQILAKQVLDLTKELEKAKLKIVGLETIIEVSEQDLHIKIIKKPGAKQSKN